ncbi:MAG TPA: RHS repeat-associated core domain-containing protein [Longimicrobiaceae bacterium]|nr:RHS repeat-associated core domain-containing protein [Longimicrobiaceae bacterium]
MGYVYDGQQAVLELDGAGAVRAWYAFYPGVNRPYLMERGGERYYYLTEVPGHVAGLIDSTGALVNQYRYSPFGEAEVVREQVQNPLRFTAREYDAETGLYYYRARYYDPALARFISEDPIGLEGGINPYAYAGNDPVNFTDPFGLCVGVGSTGRGVHTVACPFHDRAEMPWGLQSAGAALERDWEAFQKMFRDMQAEVLRNATSSEFWSDAMFGDSSICGHPEADPNRCTVAATFPDWIGPGGAARRNAFAPLGQVREGWFQSTSEWSHSLLWAAEPRARAGHHDRETEGEGMEPRHGCDEDMARDFGCCGPRTHRAAYPIPNSLHVRRGRKVHWNVLAKGHSQAEQKLNSGCSS